MITRVATFVLLLNCGDLALAKGHDGPKGPGGHGHGGGENKHPDQLVFTYTGDSCAATTATNPQFSDDNSLCTDDPTGCALSTATGGVTMEFSGKNNFDYDFSDVDASTTQFTIGEIGEKVPAWITVTITDANDCTVEMEIHASCSMRLEGGMKFGPLTLQEILFEEALIEEDGYVNFCDKSDDKGDPTPKPTMEPQVTPTEFPTATPTPLPTSPPTPTPTAPPTPTPTAEEGGGPAPTPPPTESPTKTPTETPTENPTRAPTASLTCEDTDGEPAVIHVTTGNSGSGNSGLMEISVITGTSYDLIPQDDRTLVQFDDIDQCTECSDEQWTEVTEWNITNASVGVVCYAILTDDPAQAFCDSRVLVDVSECPVLDLNVVLNTPDGADASESLTSFEQALSDEASDGGLSAEFSAGISGSSGRRRTEEQSITYEIFVDDYSVNLIVLRQQLRPIVNSDEFLEAFNTLLKENLGDDWGVASVVVDPAYTPLPTPAPVASPTHSPTQEPENGGDEEPRIEAKNDEKATNMLIPALISGLSIAVICTVMFVCYRLSRAKSDKQLVSSNSRTSLMNSLPAPPPQDNNRKKLSLPHMENDNKDNREIDV